VAKGKGPVVPNSENVQKLYHKTVYMQMQRRQACGEIIVQKVDKKWSGWGMMSLGVVGLL
jgi:hypothetical protein